MEKGQTIQIQTEREALTGQHGDRLSTSNTYKTPVDGDGIIGDRWSFSVTGVDMYTS